MKFTSSPAARRAQIEALYTLKRKLLVLDHATGPLLEVAGQAARRARAANLRRSPRLLPRRLRSPAAAQAID